VQEIAFGPLIEYVAPCVQPCGAGAIGRVKPDMMGLRARVQLIRDPRSQFLDSLPGQSRDGHDIVLA
jgi:hypothetical protein